MIEAVAEKIVNAQIKYPKLFLLFFGIMVLVFIPGILRLTGNVEPSLEKVLPQEIAEVKTMNDMRSEFGADMMYLVVYTNEPVYDIRNPEYLKYIDLLSQKLRTRDYILEVNNIVDVVKETNIGVIPDSQTAVDSALSNNPFTFQFTNEQYSFSVIRIRSDTGASAALIKQVIDDINFDIESVEEFNPGSRIEITGFNAIDKATFEVIMSDFVVITFFAMGLIAIVVLVTFRSLVKGLLPMVVVMNALIWTMGVVGYLGFTITVVSMVSAAMIMGLGIDFGIHVVHSYFAERRNHSKKTSLTNVMKELGRAMLGASLTTIAGFLALLFGVLPALKTLGVILAIGIFNTLIGVVFLLPVIVYLYDKEDKFDDEIYSKKVKNKLQKNYC